MYVLVPKKSKDSAAVKALKEKATSYVLVEVLEVTPKDLADLKDDEFQPIRLPKGAFNNKK